MQHDRRLSFKSELQYTRSNKLFGSLDFDIVSRHDRVECIDLPEVTREIFADLFPFFGCHYQPCPTTCILDT